MWAAAISLSLAVCLEEGFALRGRQARGALLPELDQFEDDLKGNNERDQITRQSRLFFFFGGQGWFGVDGGGNARSF